MDDSRIIKTEYSEEMQKSFIDYAMSVIIARALPDVRDGLKPVQRRTLYDMHELGIRYDRPYRKSARIVGDTMGKYHPHGDSSIYEALVVMSQDFKKGMPLIDGHGNFGNIEGDGAAAMRRIGKQVKGLCDLVTVCRECRIMCGCTVTGRLGRRFCVMICESGNLPECWYRKKNSRSRGIDRTVYM